MKARWVAVMIATIATAGCVIAPAKYMNTNVATALPGTHAVSVERGKWFGAAHAAMWIYVDDVHVANLYGGEAINLHLKDGRHLIGVAVKSHGENRPEREIAVDVSASSQPILRAGPVAAGYGGWGIARVN